MSEVKDIGNLGEYAAAEYLKKNGYSVVERNFRTRFGEIDIIAKDRHYIVFAEVKTRKSPAFADAREYVDFRKQARLIKTAELWLASNRTVLQPRFDVLEVYYGENFEDVRINHISDAFGVR